MKKLALTNLIVLIAIKSVSACTYLFDPLAEEKSFYSQVYFFTLVILILANVFLYFTRKQKDILLLIFILGIVIVMIPITFFGVLMEHCDFLNKTLKLEATIFIAITVFHVILWLTKSGSNLPSRKNINLPSIKL